MHVCIVKEEDYECWSPRLITSFVGPGTEIRHVFVFYYSGNPPNVTDLFTMSSFGPCVLLRGKGGGGVEGVEEAILNLLPKVNMWYSF